MKIVLVFPPFYLESMYNLPPLGLINLATALKDTPHEVVIMDFVLYLRKGKLGLGKDIYDDCAGMILEQEPDLVGFSAQCATYPPVIQIAGRIKARRPQALTVIGGHNASFADRLTLERYHWIDAIIRGEGEITFRKLIKAYDSGYSEKGIEGVTYRRGNEIIRNKDRTLIQDLDMLPLPDYTFTPPFSEYRDACDLPRSIAILEVGRGCPHRCIYCSESIFWRRRPRNFSVDRLTKEMHYLHTNSGAECFLLAYDQFTAKKGFVEAFCRRVIEERLNHIPWYCISRLDTVDASLLKLMRDAGCESMCYGIDSGSKRTLTFIRKNIDEKLLYQRVRETTEQEIIPTLSFVIGFPEEEKEDIDATLTLALKTGALGNINPLIQMPTVLPGTDLCKEYGGRLSREVDTYFSLGIGFDNGKRLHGDEGLINKDPLIYSSFYNLPCNGHSSAELNLIASYFPLMVNFYAKTCLLLTIGRRKSTSALFFEWLYWLTARLKRDQPTLCPQDCYRHFTTFVHKVLQNKKKGYLKHLPDILKYETLGLEAGKSSVPATGFHIDLNKIQGFTPRKSEGIVIGEFDFEIPLLIRDFKAGIFMKDYQPRETILVFRHEGEQLEVTEINDFGSDFLNLCDGRRTLPAISDALYPCCESGMSPGSFFESCLKAAQVLGRMGLLEPGDVTVHRRER